MKRRAPVIIAWALLVTLAAGIAIFGALWWRHRSAILMLEAAGAEIFSAGQYPGLREKRPEASFSVGIDIELRDVKCDKQIALMIARLFFVRGLSLHDCSISKDAMAAIAGLDFLDILAIYGGDVDHAALAEIGRFKSVKEVKLFDLSLSEVIVGSIAGVAGLEHLSLLSCEISAIRISKAGKLRGLWLDGTQVDELTLQGLPQLEAIEFEADRVAALRLSDLPAIREFVTWYDWTEEFETRSIELEKLPNLNTLRIWDGCASIDGLRGLTGLRVLDCRGMPASVLSSLPDQVEDVSFADPFGDVAPDLLQQLPALTRLRRLSLTHFDLRGVDLGVLQKCPGIKHLCLSGTDLGNDALRVLAEMPGLIELDVRDNPLTADAAAILSGMSRLQVLRINSEGLTHFDRGE